MSKIKPYDEEEGASEGGDTCFRNLRDLEPAEAEEKSEEAPIHEFEEEEETIVEDWDFEPEEEEEEIKESNHLMIEAEDPAAGLAMALDSLKKIHRELGTKHPVARSAVQTFPIAASHRWRSAWQARIWWSSMQLIWTI